MSDTTLDFSPSAAPLAEKLLTSAREIIARYPAGRERSALLPLLHLVQTEEGFVSPNGVAFCAEVLGINKAQVGAVATFYTMYKRRPTGEYLVSVCTNTLCNVLGGQEVYDGLVEHLGVGHDQTTPDGKITLEHAECLAACDYAPVVTVNYDFAVDNTTPQAAVELVEKLRNGEQPVPVRGARICSLKEMQVQLAGFADERDGAIADGPAGAPTLRGVTLAQEHGVAVANFNIDTPITTTKPARDESAKAVKDPGPVAAAQPAEEKHTGLVATVAQKVKAAAATVVDKVEHRKAGAPVKAGDVKDPEVRAAEARNPTGDTPAPDAGSGGLPNQKATPTNPAEAAGVAQNAVAGDGKPAGDTERGESIVQESAAEHKQNAQRGNEEKK
jgi:NADH-quinone oxidoreductase subunit E